LAPPYEEVGPEPRRLTCQIACDAPDRGSIAPPARHLRDDELFLLYCRNRDGGDTARALELWQDLAVRNFDRVQQLVKAFTFPGGGRIHADRVADATQESFVRVMAMGKTFRESALGQFRLALVQCVRHACMDYGRKELRHDRRAGGSLDERYAGDDEAGPFDAAIARFSRERAELEAEALADEAAREDAHELAHWGIAQIENANHREVLELTLIEGLAGDEIADRLGISPDNVYQRRHRGLKRLEGILRDHGSRPSP
jgi:RNA polymerase sigma factor (sigma-70 family)